MQFIKLCSEVENRDWTTRSIAIAARIEPLSYTSELFNHRIPWCMYMTGLSHQSACIRSTNSSLSLTKPVWLVTMNLNIIFCIIILYTSITWKPWLKYYVLLSIRASILKWKRKYESFVTNQANWFVCINSIIVVPRVNAIEMAN